MKLVRSIVHCCAAVLIVVLSSTITSSPAYALDRSMLETFGKNLSDQMCSDGGKWLLCYGITARSCATVTQRLINPCIDETFAGVQQQQLEYDQALAKAQKLQQCINTKFESTYGHRKAITPECAKPPAHMQDKPQ